MIVKPTGKITAIGATTITAPYPSGGGQTKLYGKEILRASVVKIDNQSDTPIVARIVEVDSLDPSTGEPFSVGQIIDVETFNHLDVIIKPAETIYIRKKSVHTTIDNPIGPTYVPTPNDGGQTIHLLLAEGQTAGTGYVYASPVVITG